jgi:hypothetical protein
VNKDQREGRGYSSSGPVGVAYSVGSLLLLGNEPKLLHHAQIIVGLPLFYYAMVKSRMFFA